MSSIESVDQGVIPQKETEIRKPEKIKEKKYKFEKTALGYILSIYPMMKSEKAVNKFLSLPSLKLMENANEHLKYKKAFKGLDNNVYTGTVNERNQRQGFGMLVMNNGSIYEGSFENGKMREYGRLISEHGEVYEGV